MEQNGAGHQLCSETSLPKRIFRQQVMQQQYAQNRIIHASYLGAIALLACRQKMCTKCKNNDYSEHPKHDVMFQKNGVYTIIFWTWAMAAGEIKAKFEIPNK